MPNVDNALDKIRQVMQTLANLLVERKKENDKNASLISHIMHGAKVSLSKFLKLTPLTFKGAGNSKDPL